MTYVFSAFPSIWLVCSSTGTWILWTPHISRAFAQYEQRAAQGSGNRELMKIHNPIVTFRTPLDKRRFVTYDNKQRDVASLIQIVSPITRDVLDDGGQMKPRQHSLEPLWTKEFIILMSSAVFMYFAAFMFNPTLPLYARSVGLTDPSVGGFIIFAYTMGSLLPRIFWGNLADRWGRRKVYLTGLVIMILAIPLLGLWTTLFGIIGVRFLQGTGFSATSTSGGTMSADLVPASRRAEGIGYYALANTMGMALAPALGLFLMQQISNAALLVGGVIAGSLSLLGGLFIRYERNRKAALKNPAEEKSNHGEKVSQESDAALAQQAPTPQVKRGFYLDSHVLKTALIAFFVVFPYGGIIGYIASYGQDIGVAQIGLYFTCYAMAVFVVRLFVGKMSDRYGIPMVLIPGIVSMAAGLVILFWAQALPLFLVSAVLFGFGFGSVVPVLQATAYTFCPADRRGAVSATLFATMDLAYGLGAIFLGLGVKYIGYRYAFVGSASIVMLGLVMFVVVLMPSLMVMHKENVARREASMQSTPIQPLQPEN